MTSDQLNNGFDIVVANYNNSHFLLELLASIESQTHTNWHLTIVDDASTDNNSNLLAQLETHPHVTILKNTVNIGVCGTFHRGITCGKNSIIGLLGADDTLPNQALEKVIQGFAANPDASMIYTQAMQCDAAMNPISIWPHSSQIDNDEHISNQLNKVFNFITFTRAAYENSPGLDTRLRKAMDHDLTLKLHEEGRIHYIPEPLYNYRCHVGGISQGKSGTAAAQYSLLAQLRSFQRVSRTPISNKARRKKHHLYHTRSVFMDHSSEGLPLLIHALKSLSSANNFSELRTSFAAIRKSITT